MKNFIENYQIAQLTKPRTKAPICKRKRAHSELAETIGGTLAIIVFFALSIGIMYL